MHIHTYTCMHINTDVCICLHAHSCMHTYTTSTLVLKFCFVERPSGDESWCCIVVPVTGGAAVCAGVRGCCHRQEGSQPSHLPKTAPRLDLSNTPCHPTSPSWRVQHHFSITPCHPSSPSWKVQHHFSIVQAVASLFCVQVAGKF